MSPSPAAHATTTAPPAPSWRLAVARALHPSAGLGAGLGDGLGIGDDDVLASIAAGLAAVAGPGEADGSEPTTTLRLANVSARSATSVHVFSPPSVRP